MSSDPPQLHRGQGPLVTTATLTRRLESILSLAKHDPGMQSDALRNASIALGFAKAPFQDLVILLESSLRPPFNPEIKKDHLLLSLDNLPTHNAIKTLLYTGVTLATHSDIHKWPSYRKEHQINKMLEAFFEAWRPLPKVVSPVDMPLDIPPTPLPMTGTPCPHFPPPLPPTLQNLTQTCSKPTLALLWKILDFQC